MNIIDNFLNIAGVTNNKKPSDLAWMRIAVGCDHLDNARKMNILLRRVIYGACGQKPVESRTYNCYSKLESKELGLKLYIFNMYSDVNAIDKYLDGLDCGSFNYYSMSNKVIDILKYCNKENMQLSLDVSISKNISHADLIRLIENRCDKAPLKEKIKMDYTPSMDVASMYPNFDMVDKFVGYCKADLDILTETVQATLANIKKEGEDNMALKIKDVIFNNPATIVFWNDGTKTVVQAREDDVYDREKGLAMAISKKVMGNKRNYYETYKKWIGKDDKKHNK